MRRVPGKTTVLVTGGGGFLGSAIAAAAREAGFETHITWRWRPPPDHHQAHRVWLDDPLQTSRLIEGVRPDVVVNAIGGPHRPSTPLEKRAAWRDGPLATSMVLEACVRRDLQFVHLASSHEYAPSTAPHDETSPSGPVSLRGVTALAGTRAVRLWSVETGAPTTVLRPFSVYGEGEPADRVIPTVLRAATTGTVFRATAGPSSRDFVFVGDVAAAVVTVIAEQATGEFNLGSGTGTSVGELVAAAEVATDRSIAVMEGGFASRPWDREHWVADPSRAREVLGWKSEISLIDGLRRCLR